MTVTKVAAAAFEKLLHSNITLNNLSVSLRSFVANFAPVFPLLDKCFNLYLFIDIKLVSEIEKKADTIKRIAKRIIWFVSEKLNTVSIYNSLFPFFVSWLKIAKLVWLVPSHIAIGHPTMIDE